MPCLTSAGTPKGRLAQRPLTGHSFVTFSHTFLLDCTSSTFSPIRASRRELLLPLSSQACSLSFVCLPGSIAQVERYTSSISDRSTLLPPCCYLVTRQCHDGQHTRPEKNGPGYHCQMCQSLEQLVFYLVTILSSTTAELVPAALILFIQARYHIATVISSLPSSIAWETDYLGRTREFFHDHSFAMSIGMSTPLYESNVSDANVHR